MTSELFPVLTPGAQIAYTLIPRELVHSSVDVRRSLNALLEDIHATAIRLKDVEDEGDDGELDEGGDDDVEGEEGDDDDADDNDGGVNVDDDSGVNVDDAEVAATASAGAGAGVDAGGSLAMYLDPMVRGSYANVPPLREVVESVAAERGIVLKPSARAFQGKKVFILGPFRIVFERDQVLYLGESGELEQVDARTILERAQNE